MRAFGNYSLLWLRLDSLCTAQIYRFPRGGSLASSRVRRPRTSEPSTTDQCTCSGIARLVLFLFFRHPQKPIRNNWLFLNFQFISDWLLSWAMVRCGIQKVFFLTCTPTCPAFSTPPPALFARPEIAQALLFRRNHHGKWIVSRRAIEQAGTLCRVPNDSRCPENLLRWYSRERALFY